MIKNEYSEADIRTKWFEGSDLFLTHGGNVNKVKYFKNYKCYKKSHIPS